MSNKILESLYNKDKQLFVLYKTKQFNKLFLDLSKINYDNKSSKMYYYEIFFDENTQSSVFKIHLNTDNLIHNVQINYYSLQLHSNINKLLYLYDNQIITIHNKFIEVEGNTIYIYPFILIYNHKLYYIKSNTFNYRKNDFVFEISIPQVLIDVNQKLQLFIKIQKKIRYYSEVSVFNRQFQSIRLSDFFGNLMSTIQSDYQDLFLDFQFILNSLEEFYLNVQSTKTKLNIEQMFTDTVKILLLFKNKLERNEVDEQFKNYIYNYVSFMKQLINLKISYEQLMTNQNIEKVLENGFYKVSDIVYYFTQNDTLYNLLNSISDITLKRFFELVDDSLNVQINQIKNSNLPISDQIRRSQRIFINMIYENLIQYLVDVGKLLNDENQIFNELYNLYNEKSSKVERIISQFKNGQLILPSYLDLYNLYVKIMNSNVIIDTELNSQISNVNLESVQFIKLINKNIKKQNRYLILDNELYLKDEKYDNIYVSRKSEYYSDNLDLNEILLYVCDIKVQDTISLVF